MDAVALLAQLNLRNHSSRVGKPAEGMNSQDTILQGLTDEQVRKVPQPGMNSIAWVLWHMARSEDIGVHLVGGRKQVFEEGNWAPMLKVADRHGGTGHTPADVARVSTGIDLAALLAYRAAVGQRTQEVLRSLTPAALERKVELAAVRRAIAVGAYGESPNVADLEKNWPTRSFAYAITVYGVTHNVGHLGEATTIKGLVTAK